MIIPIAFFIVLVGADQLIKLAVVKHLMPVGSIEIIKGFFSLTYVENRGAAFGTLQGAGWLFVVIAAAALVFCVLWYRRLYIQSKTLDGFSRVKNILIRIALVLVGSGAVGNAIDRLVRGYVVDMLDFNLFGWNYPVFNFADICVCIGAAIILVFAGFLGDTSDKTEEKQ